MEKFSDEELLLELIRRNDLRPAPTTTGRNKDHSEIIVGIGQNHVASIVMENDAYAALLSNILTFDRMVNEYRPLFNDICLMHDHELARIIGVHQDDQDCYYIGLKKRGEIVFYSAVGACVSLRSLGRYEQIETIFNLNGAPPATEFRVTSERNKE